MRFPVLLGCSLAVLSFVPSARAEEMYAPQSQACVHGCAWGNCPQCQACETCEEGGFAATCRKIRRSWFWWCQKKKHLQHPECPPFCDPNWGYYPACWRKFPPLCNPCPPANATTPPAGMQPMPQAPGTTAPPAQKQPAPSSASVSVYRPSPASVPVFNLSEPAFSPDEKVWQPTQSIPAATAALTQR